MYEPTTLAVFCLHMNGDDWHMVPARMENVDVIFWAAVPEDFCDELVVVFF